MAPRRKPYILLVLPLRILKDGLWLDSSRYWKTGGWKEALMHQITNPDISYFLL